MLEPLASVCAAAICQSSLLGFSGLLTYGAESQLVREVANIDLALLQCAHQPSVTVAALLHLVTPKKVENGFTRPVGGHSGW